MLEVDIDNVTQLNPPDPSVCKYCPELPPVTLTFPTAPKLTLLALVKFITPFPVIPAAAVNVFADILLAPEILPPLPVVVILFALILPTMLALPLVIFKLPTTFEFPITLELPLIDNPVNNPRLVILD